MRLYLDENLSPRIAELARGLGVDVVSAHEAGQVGADDRAQLLYAARDGRSLVTQDRADFVALTVSCFEEQAPHAGVLLVPSSLACDDFMAVARALQAYAERHGDAPTAYVVDFLRPGQGAR